jgi:uncharacterized protein YqjF (DUF2071 family)
MPRPFMTARWVNLGIITYAVPPQLLAHRLPRGVELDVVGGNAFVSLVAFDFRDARVLGVRWPGYLRFPELNLRYYVRRGRERGVVFLREFVDRHLVTFVARTFFNENYRVAPVTGLVAETPESLAIELQLTWRGQTHRLAMKGSKPGVVPPASSAEHYFTELRWGFGVDRHGQTVRYEVRHPPWKIYPLEECTVDLDWAEVYGKEWFFLNSQRPYCAALVAGSEVVVYPRAQRAGQDSDPDHKLYAQSASGLENSANLPGAHSLVCEGKGAVLAHLAGGTKKGAKSGATESAADADASDPHR